MFPLSIIFENEAASAVS